MIPKHILDQIPPLYSSENLKASEVKVHCEILLIGTAWAWYITEIDPKENLAFGWIKSGLGSDCSELGYINLQEIIDLKRPYVVTKVDHTLELCQNNFR
jgi:hypothetical protein